MHGAVYLHFASFGMLYENVIVRENENKTHEAMVMK